MKHLDKYRLIGKRIAYYRKQKGLSQEALANKIGISRNYISLIEAPQSSKPFSLDVLLTICEGLNIEPFFLFVSVPEGEGDMTNGLKVIGKRIEMLREQLNEAVDLAGIDSKEAMLVSRKLDEVITLFLKLKST